MPPAIDADLTRAAGHPVHCTTYQAINRMAGVPAEAVTDTWNGVIFIGPWGCANLRIAAKPSRNIIRRQDKALAVLLLAHEVAHVEGYGSELAAQCRGWRTFRPLVRKLGVARAEVWRMRRLIRAVSGRTWLTRCAGEGGRHD